MVMLLNLFKLSSQLIIQRPLNLAKTWCMKEIWGSSSINIPITFQSREHWLTLACRVLPHQASTSQQIPSPRSTSNLIRTLTAQVLRSETTDTRSWISQRTSTKCRITMTFSVNLFNSLRYLRRWRISNIREEWTSFICMRGKRLDGRKPVKLTTKHQERSSTMRLSKQGSVTRHRDKMR